MSNAARAASQRLDVEFQRSDDAKSSCVPRGRRACAIVLSFICVVARAADQPYGHGDITLGAAYRTLATTLDFRDLYAALADRSTRETAKPDLGRRGYGCLRRDDAYADVTCVSHDEKIGSAETREVRLQFLGGVLQQFSITAEIRHFGAVMETLREKYGEPERIEPTAAGGYVSYQWRNGESSIVGYSGKDLVFLSFELASYQVAVKRRQEGLGQPANECR